MSDTRDPQAVIAAAEQAANGGDFPAAERLLLEAANLQEASLGPAHPDLANTYNNLGVVYEITGKPEEAESSFRRAYKIATVAFPAEHPFVATSRKNLEDFCATRGVKVDPDPPARPAPPVPPAAPTTPPTVAPATSVKATEPPKPTAVEPKPAVVAKPAAIPKPADAPRATASSNRTPPRSDALGQSRGDAIEEPPRSLAWGAGAAFVVLLAIVAIGLWYRSRGVEPPAATSQSSQPGPETTAAPATPPATPAKPAPKPAEQPATKAVTPPKPPPAKPETRTAAAAPAKGAPTVVEASVCRNLVTSGNWRCQAPPSPIAAGPLVFYTRVKSERNTKVQHRWYRGNQLVKSSDLMITANPGTGYRTYSRLTVSGSGDWRVELRSADGALLREERFTVR